MDADVTALEPHTQASPVTSLPLEYNKRLMVFGGRSNPELAGRISCPGGYSRTTA